MVQYIQQFARMTRRVSRKYPRLDETTRRPGSTFGKNTVDEQAFKKNQELVGKILKERSPRPRG